MPLENIELSDEDQKELREQLETWKQGVIDKVEEELTLKYEEMESTLKEEYTTLVGDIREKMKKVFTKRFVTALKEMYEQIKAEVLAESYDTPEMKVLDTIKTLVYPLIDGTEAERYASEFVKMAEMNEELQEELEVTKGRKKLMELVENLSEEVKKVVVSLIGEGTEEEVVERFAAIKEALTEAKKKEDELEFEEEPEEEEEEEEEGKKKKKKKKKEKKEKEEEEPKIEEPEFTEEEIRIKSKTGDVEPLVEEENLEKEEFNETLQEMLELSGIE